MSGSPRFRLLLALATLLPGCGGSGAPTVPDAPSVVEWAYRPPEPAGDG